MRKIIIVVPCYNEGDRLPVDTIRNYMSDNPDVGFCFVNDGSKDNTLDIIKDLTTGHTDQAFYIDLPSNRGKAEAVRQGILHSLEHHKAKFLGYWDADLSTPLWQITDFMDVFERNPQCACVLGCRLRRLGVRINRKPLRHYLGRIFATLVSMTVSLPLYDSQCGAKIMRFNAAEAVFKEPFISKWFFDVELIARLKALLKEGILKGAVIELPLKEWHDIGGSKVRFRHYLQAMLDLLRIFLHYRPTI